MARIRGRNVRDENSESNENENAADNSNEEVNVSFGDEDDAFAQFLGSAPDLKENEKETPEVTNDVTPEVETEVENPEVENAEAVNEPPAKDEVESALSEAAKEIAERATGHAVEMLEVSSIPPTAFIASSNLMTLDLVAKQIQKMTEEFRVGTSNKDEKVKNAIANLTEESDPDNFNLAKSVADAKRQIEELEDLIERNETQLYESVESRLKAEGNDVWDDETIENHKQRILEQYSAYVKMHGATREFIDTHRSHTPADNLGTIDQYHVKLSKPFSKARAASNSGTRTSSGAPRNVSVRDARVSYDNGVTWRRVEGKMNKDDANAPVLSNPMFLGSEIARLSSETGNEIKSRLYSEWYAAAGFPDRVPSAEEMPEVTPFEFEFKNKEGGTSKALVQFTKKAAVIEV